MRDITEDEVRRIFAERTFFRGLRYFESGHVEIGVKKENNLTGTVWGSAPHPYRVNVEIADGIHAECTCPVGVMCKHGVALLLQWIHDKGSFVDCDHLLTLLGKKSKKELIGIFNTMLENDPVLASRLAFSQEPKEKFNSEAISKRLRYIERDLFDYYAASGVIRELEEVRKLGEDLAEKGCYNDAAEVYLLLIEWAVDAFESGVDDSSGSLGEVVIECVEDFKKISKELGKEQKRLICRIVDIIEVEDYGLETEEMLFSVAERENMSVIEAELLKRIPTSGEEYHAEYQRRKILNVLSDLYRELGMQESVLKVMRKTGLKNTDDYVRLAETLIEQGEHTEAFKYIQQGLIGGIEIDGRLGNLYFALLHQFLMEKGGEVNVEEAMTTALGVLSHFDPGSYAIMKSVFEKIGKHEEFMSNIKKKCREDIVTRVLLYEDRIDEAVEHAFSSPLDPRMLIEVAEAAKEKGKEEAARKLTLKALKKGYLSANASVSELIQLFVRDSDESELKEAIESVRNVDIARIFVDALLERNQEIAVLLLKRVITDIRKEEIKRYTERLEGRYALDICHFWVSEFINRSHVYYDDAVDILRVMRGIADEREWKRYITTLMEHNAGKKKLLEKIRKTLLIQENQ